MSARFSFIFFQKKPKNYHGGPIPIYMRVSIDTGEQKFLLTDGGIPQGGVLIIDELDARLHPLVSTLIVQFLIH